MSSSSAQAAHSLAFRVMRLCRPSFHVDTPLRFDPCDLIAGEDFFDDPVAASNLPRLLSNHPFSAPDSDLTYRSRFLLHDPSDAIGLSGLLVLPQAFGAIYLGETFCSYISINNSSNFEARDIIIKAEIQTERQRIMLLDTSKSPVESIRAGGRYDFIVEHDVKELGAHTLVCTATYNDGDSERKYLPQFFKFLVANPLSVRTKVRVVKEITFLEACIENHTKANLYMDQVDFEPAQHWSATILKADQHHPENSLTREIFKPPILIKSGGGIYNYLYQLRSSTQGSTQMEVEGSNVLGKFQITWRTNLGEPGRLQTQQILGSFEEILGKGAMKTVYKAIDEVLGMEVAWNQVKLNDLLRSSEDLQRLYSEVHLLSTLNHDSIMQFYTSWIDVDRRTFNFITEMFTSGTLREYRKKYKLLDVRAIRIWARQILSGLVYLHGHDPPVIHRDLKCDNIFVNGHLGQVKIGDLGLAAVLRGSLTAHSVIGTPEFMAPELYEESYNELVDVYSFGMCVLEMLTSEYPYSECTNPAQIYKKVTSGKLPKAFYKIEDLEAQKFVGKCLETASKRLSAKELLLDPFLAVGDDDSLRLTNTRIQKPFLNGNIGIADLRRSENPPRTDMTITGKLNPEDDAIFLKVQIPDEEGSARNVYFPFDIASDTPLDVATEMVKELEITDWEPFEIADMIDEEISALIPNWKKRGQPESDYWEHHQEDDDGHHHLLYSFSSCSSSQVSLPGFVNIHKMDTSSQRCDWIQDDLFDDTSSQSSLRSEKYSNLNYYSCEEPGSESIHTVRDLEYSLSNIQKSTRFCPEETSSTGQHTARNYHKQNVVLLNSDQASTSKDKWLMDSRRLTRNQSLVDMRSQLLHRSLVEEVNKRRLFKTVGAVENIGFQNPCKVSAKGSKRSDGKRQGPKGSRA